MGHDRRRQGVARGDQEPGEGRILLLGRHDDLPPPEPGRQARPVHRHPHRHHPAEGRRGGAAALRRGPGGEEQGARDDRLHGLPRPEIAPGQRPGVRPAAQPRLREDPGGRGRRPRTARFPPRSCKAPVEVAIPQALRFINAGVNKMEMLLSGLLRYSRGWAAIAFTIQPLDMNEMVAEILAAMRFQIDDTSAEVQVGPAARLPGGPRADQPGLLPTCSTTRSSTAPRTGRSGSGSAAASKDGMAVYSVADNGIGIAPSHQGKAFEIFHRLNPDTRQRRGPRADDRPAGPRARRAGRFGLRAGREWARLSIVALPAGRAPSLRYAMPQAPVILIVEDDEGHAILVRDDPGGGGPEQPDRAFPGRAGGPGFPLRGRARPPSPQRPHLPHPSRHPHAQGRRDRGAAADQVRPGAAKLPVIMLTTTDDSREVDRCHQLGCSVYIQKPVDYEKFAEAIRRLGLFIMLLLVPPAGGPLMASGLQTRPDPGRGRRRGPARPDGGGATKRGLRRSTLPDPARRPWPGSRGAAPT